MVAGRPTLAGVAARALVSLTTASYVLNGRDQEMRITQQTRDKVLRAAAELDYRPSLLARKFQASGLQSIAMITDTVASDSFSGPLLDGALAAAARHNHFLMVAQIGGDPVFERQVVRGVLDRGFDKVVWATRSTQRLAVPVALRDTRLVLLNCFDTERVVPAVLPDEEGSGRSVADLLLTVGYRDGIYLLGGQSTKVVAAAQRALGLRAGLADAGAQLAGVIECDWWPESAERAVLQHLDRHRGHEQRPRVLVCQNDRAALGAYQALASARLTIPTDVSVVSFEGSSAATWIHPRLTATELPHYQMGVRAVERLLDAHGVAGSPGLPVVELVPTVLRDRESVAPIGRATADRAII